MQNVFDVVQTRSGNAIPGALVYVYDSNNVLATLYSDNGVTTTPNPLTTNSDGEYQFYAANGTYSLVIAATGYDGQTINGKVLFDPADAIPLSVKNFGAKGDGVTDDTAAIQAAFDYVNAQGGGAVYLPSGRYRKADTPGSQWTMYSNTTLCGAGDSSVIFWDDKDTVPRSGNDLLACNNANNITFKDFKIEGTALTYTNETNQKQTLTGSVIDGLRIENVTIEKVRYMATAFSYAKNVVMSGNRLDYVVRDGLRCTNSDNVVITGNTLRRVADDAVALHSLDAATTPSSGFIVSGNTFEGCQGIKILGAKAASITDNVMRRTIRGPIDIRLPGSGAEGNTPQFSINVSNNVITDTFGNLGTNFTIRLSQGLARSAGGLSTFPGINSTTFPYNYLNNIDSGTPVVIAQNGVRICDNIISRTLPDSVLYSSYGAGQLFDRITAGFLSDPTITSAYFQTHGVNVVGPATGIQIQGNTLSGLGVQFAAILLEITGSTNRQDFATISIANNMVVDCPGSGIRCLALGSGSGAKQVVIQNNTFDLDPYFRAANHNADNTWSSTSSCIVVDVNNTTGFLVGGNTIKNSSQVGIVGNISEECSANIVYSDFVGTSDNPGNKGVRQILSPAVNLNVPIDGDPTSSTFGQIANLPRMRAASMPTVGRYVAGHRVLSDSPAVVGTAGSRYMVLGWLRLTTGSNHVLNTDWSEMRVLTGT